MLEATFAGQDCIDWINTLTAANIACHRVLDANDIAHNNLREGNKKDIDAIADGSSELLCWTDNPFGYPIYLLAPNCVRVGEDHSYKQPGITPVLGESTGEVLRELGYNKAEIAELMQLNVIYEYVP